MPSDSRFFTSAVLFILLFTLRALPAYAEHVKAVRPDGALELDNASVIKLAGIQLQPESLAVVSTLLAGKDVQVEYEPAIKSENEPGVAQAYIYVDSNELDMPFKKDTSPRQVRVMINELLLSTGAARTETAADFKFKSHFT